MCAEKLWCKSEHKDLPEKRQTGKETSRSRWKKPQLEDVSGKIMAQPYIRFT